MIVFSCFWSFFLTIFKLFLEFLRQFLVVLSVFQFFGVLLRSLVVFEGFCGFWRLLEGLGSLKYSEAVGRGFILVYNKLCYDTDNFTCRLKTK